MPWTPPRRYTLQRILLAIVIAVLTLAVAAPAPSTSARPAANLTAEAARSSRSVLHKHGDADHNQTKTNVATTSRSSGSPNFERIEKNRQEMDEQGEADDSEDEYEDEEGPVAGVESGEKTAGRPTESAVAARKKPEQEAHIDREMHTQKPAAAPPPPSKLQSEPESRTSPSPNPVLAHKTASGSRTGHEKWLSALRELFIKWGYKPEEIPKPIGPASGSSTSAQIKSPELRIILQGLVGRLPPDFAKYVADVLKNEQVKEQSRVISSTLPPAITPMELAHIIEEMEASWRRHYGKEMEGRDLNQTLAGLKREWEKKHAHGHERSSNSLGVEEVADTLWKPGQGPKASQKTSGNVEDKERHELKKVIQELEVFGKTEAQKLNWDEQQHEIMEIVDDLKDLSSGKTHASHLDPAHAQQLATILADLRKASNLELERQRERERAGEGAASESEEDVLTTKILRTLNAETVMPDITSLFNRLQTAVNEHYAAKATQNQKQNTQPLPQRSKTAVAATNVDNEEQLKHKLAETPADGGRHPPPRKPFPGRKTNNLRLSQSIRQTSDEKYLERVRNREAAAKKQAAAAATSKKV